jgi:hypothetical protein
MRPITTTMTRMTITRKSQMSPDDRWAPVDTFVFCVGQFTSRNNQ